MIILSQHNGCCLVRLITAQTILNVSIFMVKTTGMLLLRGMETDDHYWNLVHRKVAITVIISLQWWR